MVPSTAPRPSWITTLVSGRPSLHQWSIEASTGALAEHRPPGTPEEPFASMSKEACSKGDQHRGSSATSQRGRRSLDLLAVAGLAARRSATTRGQGDTLLPR